MDNSQLMGKKILITGANGFIGLHLCSRLLRSGAKVYALSRTNWSTNCSAHRHVATSHK